MFFNTMLRQETYPRKMIFFDKGIENWGGVHPPSLVLEDGVDRNC